MKEDFHLFHIVDVEFYTTWKVGHIPDSKLSKFKKTVIEHLAYRFCIYLEPNRWRICDHADTTEKEFATFVELHREIVYIMQRMFIDKFSNGKFNNIDQLSYALFCDEEDWDGPKDIPVDAKNNLLLL